jgi:hypothetical protein
MCRRYKPTFDVRDALIKDLLKSPWVLELLLDLGDDGLGQLALLPLLDLPLVAYPRIQDSFRLVCDGGPLLQLERLSLELGGFLISCQL